MQIAEAKEKLMEAETGLAGGTISLFHEFERDGRNLRVYITPRFVRGTKKGRVWKSKEMLTALKNASYGLDPDHARSRGGRDGVFLLDRAHTPVNEMMRKIFDRFLDKHGSGAEEIAASLGVPLRELAAVRLVSHHIRLLGVVSRGDDSDLLVLLDWDRGEKSG